MLTFKPAAEIPMVLRFDGEVLEVFRMRSSDRIHISLLESLVLKTDKKGKHQLDINAAGGYMIQGNAVDDACVPQVNQLIEQFQAAKAKFRFD